MRSRAFSCCLSLSVLHGALVAEPATDLPSQFQFLPSALSEEFDFRAEVELASPDAAVEIAVNWQSEENTYLLQVSGEGAALARLTMGVRILLAERRGIPSPPRGSLRIVLKRRKESLRLLVNGQPAAETFDHTFLNGKLGVRASSGQARLAHPAYQPVESIYFTDDFMRSEIQGAWERPSGRWALQALPNASMSANAFYLVGAATDAPALTVTGHAFWDSYEVRAAVRMTDDAPAGLVALLSDPKNYYGLQWSGAAKGKLEILKVLDGQPTVLASCALPYHKGHWYRLNLVACHGELYGSVDGNELLHARDSAFSEGRAGMLSASPGGAHFDDVAVSDVRDIRDAFDGPDNGLWRAVGGDWARGASTFGGVFPGDACLRVRCPQHARMLLSYAVPPNCVLEADTFAVDGEFGLCFFYLDERNHWLAKFSKEDAVLVEVQEGNVIEHDRAALPLPSALRRIGVRADQNVVRVMVDGKVILCGAGGKAVRGRLGFYAAHTSETAFDNAALRFPPPPTPVYIQHEVFKGEKTMANWSAAQSDWVQVAWNGLQTNWHRGSFPGDVCVRARLRDKEIAAGGLSVCVGAVDNDPAKGHVFSVAVGKTGVYLKIQHGDQVLAERTDVPITLPGALAFTRHGDFLTIEANGLPLLYARVHEAVRGTEVGWWANGIQFTSEDVEILSSRCEVHTFNSAPVDWVPASGTWEVSNRWTCDPRWSFFSGLSANLAALWNKRPLRGDVTVEFAAGIKMDNARGGGSYAQYASDINVTLCGDGKDLTTGYNFIFGGWHNTVTRILRNNQVVAETKSSLIPAGSLHRLWLYFKAERRGKELRFWVDNNLVLRYEDPEPLPGDRVALWTWQNGVMVARVRVSAEEVLNPSLPQPEAPTWGTCVYNHPGQPGLVQPQVERLKAESAEEIGGAAFELAKLREPSTIAALVPVLQHGDENCRWQAAAALAAIGLPGVEALLKALDTPNEQVRWKAEAALRQSGPEAVHLFDKVLRAGTPVQRRSCAFILRDIPCEETYRALAHALADEDDDVRWKTADSLVRFGTPVIPSIERALRTEDVRARQAAAWVLHQVGTEAAIKPLLGALNDPDKDVRWKAAIALKEMDPRPTTALLEVVKEAGKCPREHIEWILREWKVKNTNRSRTTTEEASRSGGKQDKNRGKLVRIESEPAGASVFLNDRFLCATPGEFRLQDPGRQLLVVERAGYARVCRAIEPAQAEDMKLVLAPEPTLSLTVVSSPSFASVYLDEELKGKTPLRIAGVAAGLHTLRLVKEDCFPLQQPMELAPNQDRELRLSLTFKAEQFYLDSLKGDTNNASFRTELAHLYLLRNAFDLARDQLIQAYRLVGEGKDTGGYAGRLQQEVQKAMAAFFDYGDEKAVAEGQRMLESVFLTLIKESPTNATYWLSLATTQQQRGAWAESVKTLLDGTKQVPNDWTLFYYLGVAQYTLATQGQKGLKAEALASLQKSRTLTGEAAHHKQIDHYIAAANQLAN